MKWMRMYFDRSDARRNIYLPSLTGKCESATGRPSRIRPFFGLLICVVLFSLNACATGGIMPHHTFRFDAKADSPDVGVIDYQYGGSGQFGTVADKERVSLGQLFPAGHISGAMPIGEFLYVKWRVKSTSQIFEDKVDLRYRMPKDIEGLTVHFVIKGAQLHVYLIWPWDGKPWEQEPPKSRFDPVPGGEKRFQGRKQIQIYPDVVK